MPFSAAGSAYFERDVRKFSNELSKIISERPEILSGEVIFLGMEDLKRALGQRWEKVCERVHTAARRAIDRHLTKGDAYIRMSDDDYLIVFAHRSEGAAKLKCQAIANDIEEWLLGDRDAHTIRVFSAVQRHDGTLALSDLNADDLIATLSKANVQARTASPVLARGGTPDEPAAGALVGAGFDGGATDDFADLVEVVPRTLRERDHRRAFRFGFEPGWDAMNRAIATYRCVPQRRSAHGEWIEDGGAPPDDVAASEFVRRDLQALNAAVLALDNLLADRRHVLVVASVRFDTLASGKSRAAWLQIAHAVPAELRRYLVFELVDLPKGVASSTLIDLFNHLRVLSRIQLLQVTPDTRDAVENCPAGIHAVGVDVSQQAETSAEAIHRLRDIVGAARERQMWAYLRGLRSSGQIQAAIDAGFRYIGGAPIGRPLPEPKAAHRFEYDPKAAPETAHDGQTDELP